MAFDWNKIFPGSNWNGPSAASAAPAPAAGEKSPSSFSNTVFKPQHEFSSAPYSMARKAGGITSGTERPWMKQFEQ